MSTERYHVVFKGEIAEGQERAVVKQQLGALFKVPAATVERMFSGQTVKLKKDVDRQTALKYQAAVERTGARCHLAPVADPAGQPPPLPAAAPRSTPPPSLSKTADPNRPSMDAELSVNPGGNFYAPPGATLTDDFIASVAELRDPQRVPAGRAMRWLSSGFELFKQSPGNWIVLMVLWFVIIAVLSVIPLLSLAVNFIMPILVGGLMLGCRDQDEGEPLQVGHLFAAFQGTGGRLAALGGLQLLAFLAVVVVVGILVVVLGSGSAMINSTGPEDLGLLLTLIAIPVLIVVALSMPIAMAFWFAPLLVAVHDVGVLDSIKLSFVACLRNWLGFLVYGLILLALMIVAMIPLGLGLLVVAPVAMASIYTSHKDIFLDNLN